MWFYRDLANNDLFLHKYCFLQECLQITKFRNMLIGSRVDKQLWLWRNCNTHFYWVFETHTRWFEAKSNILKWISGLYGSVVIYLFSGCILLFENTLWCCICGYMCCSGSKRYFPCDSRLRDQWLFWAQQTMENRVLKFVVCRNELIIVLHVKDVASKI